MRAILPFLLVAVAFSQGTEVLSPPDSTPVADSGLDTSWTARAEVEPRSGLTREPPDARRVRTLEDRVARPVGIEAASGAQIR